MKHRRMMSRIFLFPGIALMLFMSGCVVSRTGEKAWSVGVIDYYADFSEIEGNVVYEKDGEYYIKAEEAGYKPDPTLIGLLTPPISHFVEYKIPVTVPRKYVILKISPAFKKYLCAPKDKEEKNRPDSDAKVVTDVNLLKPDVIKHRILRELPPPETTRFCCGDSIDSQWLYREKSAESYWLFPVVVIGYIWDIPSTAVMSVYFDFILLPNILIAKGGQKIIWPND